MRKSILLSAASTLILTTTATAQVPDYQPPTGIAPQVNREIEPEDKPPRSSPWIPSLPTLKMPKIDLMPNWKPKNPAPAIKSTWQKMNRGTKRFLSKTKHTLMPWSRPASTATLRPATGTRRIIGRDGKPVSEEKPSSGLLSVLPGFGAEEPEEPKAPQTAQEFLSRPIPQF